jgi:hypothetical protein
MLLEQLRNNSCWASGLLPIGRSEKNKQNQDRYGKVVFCFFLLACLSSGLQIKALGYDFVSLNWNRQQKNTPSVWHIGLLGC